MPRVSTPLTDPSVPASSRRPIVAPDPRVAFARAVHRGLTDGPRRLPFQYLYDTQGSALFEQICETPEYYVTRTETAILVRAAARIRGSTGPVTLVELGAGSAVKTDILLEAFTAGGQAARYVPVDISPSILAVAASRIRARFSRIRVEPIVGTYEEALARLPEESPCLVVFLGSSIGNLDTVQADAFWEEVARGLSPGDTFLLGADLVKDPAVLERAYDDAAGVTAAFTRNIFARMNRELDAGLDVESIEHVARWCPAQRRVEMWARFRKAQRAYLAPIDRAVDVRAGEEVLVEISRKFVLPDLSAHLGTFGLDTLQVHTDPDGYFALLLLRRRGDCA
jgi:L-histidine N-alpha-methyltransferase